MHTLTSLRKALALTTMNQVRNRIDTIRDVLAPHLRRGPNNQILVADEGLTLLRQLQELYDSGLTMTEASDVLRSTLAPDDAATPRHAFGFVPDRVNPMDAQRDAVRLLHDEVSFLRSRLVELEARLASPETDSDARAAWWQSLKGDVDAR